MKPVTRASLGFRAHSGWATLVALGGAPAEPAVLVRRRIELVEPGAAGGNQPYHAAEGLALAKARSVVQRCADGARRLARRALRSAVDDLAGRGYGVVGCGLLLASGRPLPELEAILASHALIHAAEGELFRDALIDASENWGLPLLRVREREAHARGAERLRLSTEQVQRRILDWGRALGPPWRQDEKLAALVAWMALAQAPKR